MIPTMAVSKKQTNHPFRITGSGSFIFLVRKKHAGKARKPIHITISSLLRPTVSAGLQSSDIFPYTIHTMKKTIPINIG
jgi:hypothetical protein